jgi:hypothetical protein
MKQYDGAISGIGDYPEWFPSIVTTEKQAWIFH